MSRPYFEDEEIAKLLRRARARPVSEARLRKAVRSIVKYNWDDELNDYLRNGEVELRHHILKDLLVLDAWVRPKLKGG